jgi:hypothetical protein
VRPALHALATLATLGACAPALREPPPLRPPTAAASGRSVDALLRDADAAWARRADPEQVRAAEALYEDAAAADERRVEGLVGAMRAISLRLEHERSAAERDALAVRAVQLGQWCARRAPRSPACAYRLAIALGEQARERHATAQDGLKRMVELLRQAIAADPRLDEGGPHRVLGLLLLRAPAWPLGPGDPEAGLREARAAAELVPDAAENQLALGEALAQNDHPEEARGAYARAAALAARAEAAGDPDAPRWRAEATKALAEAGP